MSAAKDEQEKNFDVVVRYLILVGEFDALICAPHPQNCETIEEEPSCQQHKEVLQLDNSSDEGDFYDSFVQFEKLVHDQHGFDQESHSKD